MKDLTQKPHTIATDTQNHILWIYNPKDIEAVESAILRAERQFKGSIDDYVAHVHH